MKINLQVEAPTKARPEPGDWFVDDDDDLNLVLADGGVVCFEAGHPPWVRFKDVYTLSAEKVKRILQPGESFSVTV